MPDKVLIYSRFPKAMMVRIGERFELMDAGGKAAGDVFTRGPALGHPGHDHRRQHAARRRRDGHDAETRRDRLLRHRL